FPATGSRVALFDEDALLGGGAISHTVRAALRVLERNRLDAFPSGHTALAIVYCVIGGQLLPRWRIPLTFATVGIVFATVYLSLHYVVDVVGGIVVALAVLGLERLGARHTSHARARVAA